MTDDDDAARRQRADARRGRITVSRVEEGAPREAAVRGAEAVTLVTQLSRAAWSLSGRPWPTYDRANMPGKLFRGWPE